MTQPATQQRPATAQYAVGTAFAARSVQLAVRAALLRDVITLWRLLDPKRLAETFPGWVAAMAQLVTRYHGQSAQAAAAFYRAARQAATESATPTSIIRLADAPSTEWITRALGYAGPGMLEKDTARPGTALSTVLGTSSRIALDGGRTTIAQTIQRDPVAVGWYRVTDGQPCAFCAMLAGRGVVYKRDTVNFKSHNDCGCFGAPAFSRDQPLPQVNETAARVYRERGNGPALVAFRKAWADHQAQSA